MTIKPRTALGVMVIAIATALSGRAQAFTVLGYTWPAVSVAYLVNPDNMDVPSGKAIAAVRAGADAWQQSGIPVALTYAGTTTQTTNTNDGVNIVLFRNEASGSTLATTYSWFSGNRIIDADIVFWDAGFQFFTGTTGCSGGAYIEDVATHEFGHVLGLGHSTDPTATMYPSLAECSQQSRTLAADDIAAIRSLYPIIAQAPSTPQRLRIVGGGR
jgi:poly(3-hydroxybutyrate) depolymerase